MSFNKKLQSLRKTTGLSQEDLAAELGVSRQAVSKWESGSSYPEMDKLILMTKIFKCSLDDLVNDEGQEPSVLKQKGKGQAYIDSLLEFITKSINMLTQMKTSVLLKCLFELLVLAFLLFFGSLILTSIFSGIVEQIIPNRSLIASFGIGHMINALILIVVVALDFIIFFQVYKIRYLDYYDKVACTSEPIKTDQEGEVKKQSERIIIRDSEHDSLTFLSFISRFVILIARFFLRIITIPFIMGIVALVVALVISIYLIYYNTIFIGVSLIIGASIILDILFIRAINNDLFKDSLPIGPMSIMMTLSLFIIGIGLGFVLIRTTSFELDNTIALYQKEYTYNENLLLDLHSMGDNVIYEVDDSLDTIKIEISYVAEVFDLYLRDSDASIISLEYNYKDNNVEYKNIIKDILDKLKEDKISKYIAWDYPIVKVRGSEAHLSTLVNNLRKKYYVQIDKINGKGDSYYAYVGSYFYSSDMVVCENSKLYPNECVMVDMSHLKDKSIELKYRDGELEYNEDKYTCKKIRWNYYICND